MTIQFSSLMVVVLIGLTGCRPNSSDSSSTQQGNGNAELLQKTMNGNDDLKRALTKKYPPYNECQSWYNVPIQPDWIRPEFHHSESQIPPLTEEEISEMNAAVLDCIVQNCIRLGWNDEDFRSGEVAESVMDESEIYDRTLQAMVPTPEHLTKELFLDLQKLVQKRPLWRVMIRAHTMEYLIYPTIIYVQHKEATDLEAQLRAAIQMEIDLVEPKQAVFRRKAAYIQREFNGLPPIQPGDWRVLAFDNSRGDPERIEVWLFSNKEDYFAISHPKPDMVSTSWATKDGRCGAHLAKISEYRVRIFIYRRQNFDGSIKVRSSSEDKEVEHAIERVIPDTECLPLDPGRSNKAATHF